MRTMKEPMICESSQLTEELLSYVTYLGEGSIDLYGITEHAVEIVEGGGEA